MSHWFLQINDKLKYSSKYKRIISYILILVLVVVGHYFLMQISLESFRYSRRSIMSMLCILCLGGAIILMTRKNGGRAQILFAFLMFMVGLTNLLSLINGLITGHVGVVEYKFMSIPMLIYGVIYAYIFLLYPIESFRPGWLTFRRGLLLFLPIIVVVGVYLFVVRMQNVPMPAIDNWTLLIHNFWSINVWLGLLILAYPILGLMIMLRYQNKYKEWCKNNYASIEDMDVKWLSDYIFSNFVITLSCVILVFSNNVRSILMHNIIFLFFFLYGFYRVLLYRSPYPEGYFKGGLDETKLGVREAMELDEKYESNDSQTDFSENNLNAKLLFTKKLPEYMCKLELWMQTEKPYLRKDFKLTDAMVILPLNRSYLSRLFNEGYDESFYQFVMRYRIAESKNLLLSRPDLNITSIADLSGFSSLSVFSRAFTRETNCSPLQWRNKEMTEKYNQPSI